MDNIQFKIWKSFKHRGEAEYPAQNKKNPLFGHPTDKKTLVFIFARWLNLIPSKFSHCSTK